jgi:CBS domain-containing protein
MKSVARCRSARRSWFESPFDTQTLGSLVTAPAVVVDEQTPLDEVRRVLVEQRIPAVAVIGRERALCGIVTRTDVLGASDARSVTAGQVMSHYVLSLPDATRVERAAALMAAEVVAQVMVTDADGALVGMVSALDIARYVAIRGGYLE